MNIALYLARPKAEAPTRIYARISYNGNRINKYYFSGSIHPQFWNAKAQRAKETQKFSNFLEFNTSLSRFEGLIHDVYRKYFNDHGQQDPSPEVLQNLLDQAFSRTLKADVQERRLRTFWGFIDDFISRCENGTRLHIKNSTPIAANTIKNIKNLRAHLEGYEKSKKQKLDFELIDLKFHSAFTQYLTTTVGLGINTIGKLITNLKVVLREAWEMGYTTNTVFTHRKFQSYQAPTQAVYLTEQEIEALYDLDLAMSPALERVRDVFIIGCYTGLRFSDLSRLSYQNIQADTISIVQEKTKDPVYIPVRLELKAIFSRYPDQLPRGLTNQVFNRYLKEVCARCPLLHEEVVCTRITGGKRISECKPKYLYVGSHTARRSFATNEFLAGDLQVFEIRAITGHKTDKAFYKYIRMMPKENAVNVARKWKEREARKLREANPLRVA